MLRLTPKTQNPKLAIVIGYGNDLRGDDAAGPLVAAAVAAWELPGVRALAVHQLMPELAEAIAAADLAIFVDACADCEPADIDVRRIEPGNVDTALGHTGDPRALLALAMSIYGRCPPAWSIDVPARNFAFGAGLSPSTARGVVAALEPIRSLLETAWQAQPEEPSCSGDLQQGTSHA
jgi:hydrogenase maturation protease